MNSKSKDGPTKDFAEALDISRRHARRKKAEGSDTAQSLSDRERYEKARADRTEAQAEAAKVEIEKARGDLVSRRENADSLREIVEQVKAAIYFECGSQLAIENAGLPAEAQTKNNKAAIARALRSLEDWATKKISA